MTKTISFVRYQNISLLLTTNTTPASNVKREDENLGRDMDKYMAVLSNKEGNQPAAPLFVGDKGKAPASDQSNQTTAPSSGMARRPSIGKKVSFAKEPKIDVIPFRESNIPDSSTPKSNIVEHAGVARTHPTEHMLILDDNDYVIGSEPLEVVDTSKLALEARDNMNGIGTIVASMTIDNMSDDEDYDYDEYESEELDDVDWRTLDRAPVGADLADDSYKSYIEELMKKHEAAFENVGPRHDVSILESLASEPGTGASKSDPSKSNSEGKQGQDMSRQKGVRFAEELDIQAAPARPKNPSALSEPSQTSLSENALERDGPKKPLVDSVIERTSISRPAANTPSEPSQPRKVSRFKAARSGG
jgi:unconventional prefoldin RPB5 interactor 1